jgi:uncharacterized SAM-binding protein YcdF (DUF218 family)
MEIWFSLRALVSSLILPPTASLALAILGLLLLRRRPMLGSALAWTGVLSLLVLSLPVGSWALTRVIQDSEPVSAAEIGRAQAIVILGGTVRPYAPEYGGETLGAISLERVRYGAKLAIESGLPILVTGGPIGGGPPLASMMKNVLEKEFHVPVRWVDSAARNTHENAVNSAVLLKQAGLQRVLLVTHELHIRRARAEMEAAGLEVIPAPTGLPAPRVGANRLHDWLPSANALQTSYYALHEWVGNLARAIGIIS